MKLRYFVFKAGSFEGPGNAPRRLVPRRYCHKAHPLALRAWLVLVSSQQQSRRGSPGDTKQNPGGAAHQLIRRNSPDRRS